jgi:hypothetical protein
MNIHKERLRSLIEYKGRLDARIERSEANLQMKKQKESKLEELNERLTPLQSVRDQVFKLLNEAKAEDIEFKNRRTDAVSSIVTDFVGRCFPEDGYVAKLMCDPKRGFTAELELKDKFGNERLLHMAEGKFNQSLISFGSCIGISRALSPWRLLADEPFAVSDDENLETVGEIYNELTREGVQIILIEQRELGYKNIPGRREIFLTRDTDTNTVNPPQVIDY